jgi:hypothetical protein
MSRVQAKLNRWRALYDPVTVGLTRADLKVRTTHPTAYAVLLRSFANAGGQRAPANMWCHGFALYGHQTVEKGQQAGVGLDQIRAFSDRSLATILIYRDEHDHTTVHRTLADVVASSRVPFRRQGFGRRGWRRLHELIRVS